MVKKVDWRYRSQAMRVDLENCKKVELLGTQMHRASFVWNMDQRMCVRDKRSKDRAKALSQMRSEARNDQQ